ncbi:hypothetical protein ABN357_11310 [Providencia rettgeri]|nr:MULTISPECIES: hypothetical protein [Providencia]EJD6047906.1 hypothetical protein [Providencia rettgeri]ELR5091391.1 hypothetical protein [Providencia rettgeri]ELR5103913.1 hypothetical protein [Providencia rettgeri]MBQ0606656.1 hypothetical protein [Providencia rettgeri]MCB4814440.1 hypothetical protein [Providencia rettgeri]
MTLDTKVNNQASIFININNKVIPYKKTSVIDNLNIIKPLSSESYNKINFAIQNSEFHESAQPVLNQLPYSPPVEKLLLPYTYHEDDLVSSLDIFKNSIEIKNDSLISKKKDTELMPLNKISTTETKVFKDFRLNRSAGRFSNLILEIKSTHEKGIRYLKNILKKNNNEELCVKFESGKAKIIDKATIARQNLMKQHENINDAKATNNVFYTVQQENSELYNSYKILLNEVSLVESKAKELIIKDKKTKNNEPFQYYKKFKQLNIIDILDFTKSPAEKHKKIENIFNQMKSTIRRLENYIDESTINKQLTWDDNDLNWNNPLNQGEKTQIAEFVQHNYSQEMIDDTILIINKSGSDIISEDAKTVFNEFFNDNHQDSKINSYSSNESISSNSSGYFSEPTDDVEYSLKESTKKKIISNDVTQNNNDLKNKELENTEKRHKETHNQLKIKKNKHKFNGEIPQTKTTMLRKKHNRNKYQFPLNENSQNNTLDNKNSDTKNLGTKLKGVEETINDLEHLRIEIKKEEEHFAELKGQLENLQHSVKA